MESRDFDKMIRHGINYGTGAKQFLEATNQARSDIAATKQTVSIDSVMTEQYVFCDVDFIFHSFYLPVQVLRSELYSIAPIAIIKGSEFEDCELGWKLANKIVVYEGCCPRMLMNAKQVGVSQRHILSSGQRVVVCKIWYGRI